MNTNYILVKMNTPPKYPSTPHWPWSKTVHRDDSTLDYINNFIGRKIIITEKLDGGNTCLFNGEVYARSTTSPSHAGWMAMVRKHHGWKTNMEEFNGYSFYGEDLYGIHSIEYEPIHETETFYLFAVRNGDTFLGWDGVINFASTLNLKTVPLVYLGTPRKSEEITDILEYQINKRGVLGKEREGFVIRTYDEFPAGAFGVHVCKYVRPNHVQTDEHWTRNWQPCKLSPYPDPPF